VDTEASRRIALEYLHGGLPDLLADDARLWVGAPPHYGRTLTKDEFLAFQTSFRHAWEGEWRFEFGPVVAEGSRVSAQAESFVRLRNGKTYQQQYHFYFEIRDEKIVVYKTYFDTLAFAECFDGSDALLGQRMRGTNLFDVDEGQTFRAHADEVGEAKLGRPE
jgi:ketosteroid isomerase-like protein